MADDDLKIIAIIGGVFALICGLLYFGFHQKSYTLQVKQIQWEWNVHIEQYQVVHEDGKRSKPSDAYNVKSHYHPRTKTWTDDEGRTHTKDESYWTYDYDVNRWIEVRVVRNTGYDHEPFFLEYSLAESNREDGIGSERAIEEKLYFAIGTIVGGDGSLTSVPINSDIWGTLTENDEINYKQARIGDPTEVEIAR